MSMTEENLDRLLSVLDGIHANLESQSTQIKSLAELLRPLAQPSTVQAPQEPAGKGGIGRDFGNETAISPVSEVRSAEDTTLCATTDMPAQALGEEGKPKPPTPQTMFYPTGIKTQYALGQLPLVYQLQDKAWSLVRGDKWAYWRPVFDGDKLLGGRGQPNFTPEWELCHDNGQPYHIDDHERRHPLPGAPTPGPNSSSGAIELLVPYTCSPPPTNYNGYFPQKGLGDVNGLVREALGDLCRIPSDGRVPLACEAYNLRNIHFEGELAEELQSTNTFLSKLESRGGEFSVYDIDDYGNYFRYRRQTMINSAKTISASGRKRAALGEVVCLAYLKELSWSDKVVEDIRCGRAQQRDIWSSGWAVTRSNAEEISLNIPPVFHRLEKTADGWRHSVKSAVPGAQPWYRIIHLEGCERLGDEMRRIDIYNSLFRLTMASEGSHLPRRHIFAETDSATTLLNALEEHLRPNCTRFAPTAGLSPFNHFRIHSSDPFQIFWLEIEVDGRNMGKDLDSSWHSGPLYGRSFNLGEIFLGDMRLTQHAVTLSIFQQRKGSREDGSAIWSPYYTIFLLSEPGRATSWPPHTHENNNSYRPAESVLYFIDDALNKASAEWLRVERHIHYLTQHDETVIFRQEISNSALFDDRHFSKTKDYYWATNSLRLCIDTLESTLQQWKLFWEAHEENLRMIESFNRSTFRERNKTEPLSKFFPHQEAEGVDYWVSLIERTNRDLETILGRFKSKMQQTIELRNSLMSASSVKEARDATLLAENVKSLTYVNIIFLPLSYCASLWGMDNDANTGKLIWVTVIVCLVTCLAITNLEVTVRSFRKAWRKIFSLARRPLIARMERQKDLSWRRLAEDLERSSGADEKTDTKPSEWLVLGFLFFYVYQIVYVWVKRVPQIIWATWSQKSGKGLSTDSSAPARDSDNKPQSKPDEKQNSTSTETPKSRRRPMPLLKKLRPRSNKDIEQGNPPAENTTTSLAGKDTTGTPASKPEATTCASA